jgi:hypothetical protein
MLWIADLSLAPEDQTLVNLEQVRFVTAAPAEEGGLLVSLTMGAGLKVDLRMPRSRYAELLKILDVRDIG